MAFHYATNVGVSLRRFMIMAGIFEESKLSLIYFILRQIIYNETVYFFIKTFFKQFLLANKRN